MTVAEAKFAELDKDGSGFLEPKEIEELAQWVYTSFKVRAPAIGLLVHYVPCIAAPRKGPALGSS